MQSTQDRTAQNALSLDVLWNLRTKVEKVLKEKFPATTVDVSGGKAVGISGGSLARPVDVVPSHWFDGATSSRKELPTHTKFCIVRFND